MSRITKVSPAEAEGRTRQLYSRLERVLGAVPNLGQALGASPAALEFWVGGLGALNTGRLGGKLLEQIALRVAAVNDCGYCVSAHAYLANHAGIDEVEIHSNLAGLSSDPRASAALKFAGRVIESRGNVSDDELNDLRRAGFDDAEIGEIVAAVALNVFTNYFNRLARTEIDFPIVTAPAA